MWFQFKTCFFTQNHLAGFCLKTKTEKDEKVFINICRAENVSMKTSGRACSFRLCVDSNPLRVMLNSPWECGSWSSGTFLASATGMTNQPLDMTQTCHSWPNPAQHDNFLPFGFQVPEPKDLSDEDLLRLLEAEDQSGYRIPMSIGEGHTEVDNSELDFLFWSSQIHSVLRKMRQLSPPTNFGFSSTFYFFCLSGGQGCTAYDVIVNDKFFAKLETREVLLGFVVTVVLEGLEYKYDMSLSRGKIQTRAPSVVSRISFHKHRRRI